MRGYKGNYSINTIMRKNSIFMFMLSGVLAWTAPLNDAIAQQQGGHQEHRRSHLDFKDTAVKTAWEHYVHLNEGLIATDATAARKGAAALEKSLKEVKGADKAAALAGKIAANDDLERKSVVYGTRVSVSVDIGGGSILKNK